MWATIQLVLKCICIHYILENLDTCSSHRNDRKDVKMSLKILSFFKMAFVKFVLALDNERNIFIVFCKPDGNFDPLTLR